MFHMSYTVNDQICRFLECGSQEEFTTNDALLQSQCYAAALLIRQYNVRQPIGGNSVRYLRKHPQELLCPFCGGISKAVFLHIPIKINVESP